MDPDWYELGLSQPMAKFGIIDVTQRPFSADPSGEHDSTLALQVSSYSSG